MTPVRVMKERLHKLFEYRYGVLYRRIQTGSRALVGDVAGNLNADGYWHIEINGRVYNRSRLTFLMHHGYMPKQIDHINRDKSDDRIENLRGVTRSQNQRNSDRYDNAKGCYLRKKSGKWVAQIGVNGKRVYLGFYTTEAEARIAFTNARTKYHGEAA